MNIEPHLLRYISSAASREIAQQEHEQILKACEERDSQLIEDTIARHLKEHIIDHHKTDPIACYPFGERRVKRREWVLCDFTRGRTVRE